MAILMSALTSCDPLFEADENKIGVTLNAAGIPVIVAAPCPDQTVRSFELIDPASLSDDGSTPIHYYWRARVGRLAPGQRATLAISDDLPPGFKLAVPLALPLADHATLLVSWSGLRSDGSPTGSAKEFKIEDLEQGRILGRDHLLTPDDFRAVAQGFCR